VKFAVNKKDIFQELKDIFKTECDNII